MTSTLTVNDIPHIGVRDFITTNAKLTNCKNIYICDGSQNEANALFQQMIDKGQCIKLTARENSYYFRSDVRDVARVESKTFICCEDPLKAGPLNNWSDPTIMRQRIQNAFTNAFEDRTMYVVIFCMGPIGSDMAKVVVQLTDSPYVVVNTRIMARMDVDKIFNIWRNAGAADSTALLDKTTTSPTFFIPCLHATTNNKEVAQNSTWPCDPENIFLAHFTDGPDYDVVSYGSGYGGNALLGKKCVALRIASVLAMKSGNSLAEHMLIMGIKNRKTADTTYLTCALPSACGKTNLAMLRSTMPDDVEITTLGDDIAWLKVDKEGRLRAVNAESGFFGVAPGSNNKTNPMSMQIIAKNTIFTNVALLPDKSDIFFEGLEVDNNGEYPPELIDWQGNKWNPGCGRPCAHPNSRFTSPLVNCPILDPLWDDKDGVPISAMLYGGRSASQPLVQQAFNVQHGVYMGLCSSTEMTAAQEGQVGTVRFDPFAMRPFLAMHVGDYVKHLLRVLNNLKFKPLIFYVNWFRRNPSTKQFLWKGYGANTLVVKWIVDRVHGRTGALETANGWIPRYKDFDWAAATQPTYDYSPEQFTQLMSVDHASTKTQVLLNQESLFLLLGNALPYEMILERQLFASRL